MTPEELFNLPPHEIAALSDEQLTAILIPLFPHTRPANLKSSTGASTFVNSSVSSYQDQINAALAKRQTTPKPKKDQTYNVLSKYLNKLQ